MNPTLVITGDVWQDLDPRNKREFKVLEVGDTHAVVQRASGKGPRSRIRLDRFRGSHDGNGKKGYKLVARAGVTHPQAAASSASEGVASPS